jgi:HEAT repeat protein
MELLLDLGDELYAVEYTQVLVEDQARPELSPEEETYIRQLFMADSGPVAEIFANQLALRLGARDQAERHVIRQTLVAMGGVSVGPLISALGDADRRDAGAAALGALRDTRAVPALVDVLSVGDPIAKAAAARALGDIRDPGALDALIRASGDVDANVRDAALNALDGMRGLVLAMLRAAALTERPEDRLGPPERVRDADTPQLTAPAVEQLSVLRRLLGRHA